jgi:hypothetical protein
MQLLVQDEQLAVARLDPTESIVGWMERGPISSITRTAEELSVVCAAAGVPAGVRADRGWRSLRVAGPLDFSLTGVLASIAGPLAAAKISIFAIATFDTDYVLVRETNLSAAIECLKAAGHEVVGG